MSTAAEVMAWEKVLVNCGLGEVALLPRVASVPLAMHNIGLDQFNPLVSRKSEGIIGCPHGRTACPFTGGSCEGESSCAFVARPSLFES